VALEVTGAPVSPGAVVGGVEGDSLVGAGLVRAGDDSVVEPDDSATDVLGALGCDTTELSPSSQADNIDA
jgi:hypothetical protein